LQISALRQVPQTWQASLPVSSRCNMTVIMAMPSGVAAARTSKRAARMAQRRYCDQD
jgi:hypothetical protein